MKLFCSLVNHFTVVWIQDEESFFPVENLAENSNIFIRKDNFMMTLSQLEIDGFTSSNFDDPNPRLIRKSMKISINFTMCNEYLWQLE